MARLLLLFLCGLLTPARFTDANSLTSTASLLTGAQNSECGGNFYSRRGTLTSPNYPDNYYNNLDCYWNIAVPSGIVDLTFTEFRVESCSDYLKISDGYSGDVITKFCNHNESRFVLGQTDKIRLHFHTDSGLTYRGWSLTWSAPECGGSFQRSQGSLTSPNYPGSYNNNLDCYWDIVIPSGVVTLSFADFSTESCSYDYLKIYDGNSGFLIRQLCGSIGSTAVYGRSNRIRLHFHTDSSVTYGGWSLTWSVAIPVSTEAPVTTSKEVPPSQSPGCGGSLSDSQGNLASPNYPGNYDNNLDCRWDITIPSGIVVLRFTGFWTESCSYDYVKIYDGYSGYLIRNLCSRIGSTTVYGRSNRIHLHFHTDSSVTYGGWSLTWSENDCGGTLYDSEGYLTSPNYPANYDNNLDCHWNIIIPSGAVALRFSDFRTESCSFDYLKIYDGYSGYLIINLCGNIGSTTVFGRSNKMRLHFRTDSSVTYRGWSFNWSEASNYTADTSTLETVTYPGTYNTTVWEAPVTTSATLPFTPSNCGGSFNESEGTLTSPNYPENYFNNLDCYWTITVPEGVVGLSFTNFMSELCCDFLKISDGHTNQTIIILNGNRGNASIIGYSNSVRLYFHSDQSVVYGGWSLSWYDGN